MPFAKALSAGRWARSTAPMKRSSRRSASLRSGPLIVGAPITGLEPATAWTTTRDSVRRPSPASPLYTALYAAFDRTAPSVAVVRIPVDTGRFPLDSGPSLSPGPKSLGHVTE